MMRLHYRKYGSGPPLIILHGLFGSSDNWHTLARRWSTTFSVYVLDQRNHGSSPHNSDMTYPVLATDLADFMRQEHLESALILGHSMGGKAAMLFASLYPEKVAGLAVLDIGITQITGQHQAILDVLQNLDPVDFPDRRSVEAALQTVITSSAIRQFLLKNILRRVDGSLTWKFNRAALLEHYQDLTAALTIDQPYTGPVLFLRGANSPYLPPQLTPEILQGFPHAQCTTIPGAGHWLHAEQPEQLFLQVRNFFQES